MHLKAFEHYRREEQRESQSLLSRTAATTVGQAGLFIGWAMIRSGSDRSSRAVLIAVVGLAIGLGVVTLCANLVNVVMIRRWGMHGQRLLIEDKATEDVPELMDFHLNQKPTDWSHRISNGLFGIWTPLLLLGFWGFLLACSINL